MPAQKEKTLPSGRLSRSWTNQDGVDVLRVNVEPDELLRHFDRHGRSLTTYALLQTAETAERMAGQIAELVSPTEGEDRLAQVIDLLQAIAENQKSLSEAQARTEAQVAKLVAALERIVAGSSAPSSPAHSPARPRRTASSA
jgi:predicted transcriptional regulator